MAAVRTPLLLVDGVRWWAAVLVLIGLGVVTAVAVVVSVWRDRRLIGKKQALAVIGSWLVIPWIVLANLVNLLGTSDRVAGWASLGLLWYALAISGGRLVFLTDSAVPEEPATASPPPEQVRRRVRWSQAALVAGIVVGLILLAFLAP